MKHYWDITELSDLWSLNFEELELLKTKPSRSHLPFCVQLKHYQYSGTFPKSFSDISEIPLQYLMGQLEVVEIEEYQWNGRTAERHRLEILKYLGIKKSNDGDRTEYKEWLISELIPKVSNIKELVARSEEWFLQHKLILPCPSHLIDRIDFMQLLSIHIGDEYHLNVVTQVAEQTMNFDSRLDVPKEVLYLNQGESYPRDNNQNMT